MHDSEDDDSNDERHSFDERHPYALPPGVAAARNRGGGSSSGDNFEDEFRVGGFAMQCVTNPSGQPDVALEHHRRHEVADDSEEDDAANRRGSQATGSIAGDGRSHGEAIHVACYPSFDASLLGEGISEMPPLYGHNAATIGGWVPFDAFDSNIRPKRAMCFNVPAEFLKIGATRFQSFGSDQHGSTRIADTAALLSLIFAGYSKGFLSGHHCELSGLEDENDDADEGNKKKKKKRPTRVDSYTYYPDGQAGTVAPQVAVGYEELASPAGDVLAIRVWLLIFDQEHSTSSLVARVIREVRSVHQNSKLNSVSAGARKEMLQKEQRTMRPAVMGYNMEDNSSIQYVRIYDDAEMLGIIRSYSGASTDNPGRPTLSPDEESHVPRGTNLVPIDGGRSEQADGLGSTHPLSVEWVFNAKRPNALAAGLVGCDNQLLNICEAQLDPTSYFDEVGNLIMPLETGFWLQSNPTLTNIFDMVLPQALQGAIVPGPTLLGAFRELHRPDAEVGSRILVDCFRNLVTNTDMHQARVVAAMRQVVVAPDSINVSVEERERIKHVDELLKRGPRFYGQSSESSDVIEPRNILKEVAREQSTVDRLVVEPWVDVREKELDAFELKVAALQRDCNEKLAAGRRAKAPAADLETFEAKCNTKIRAAQAQANAKQDNLSVLKNQIRQELFEYGAARIKRAFLTKSEYDLMPRGYQAIWDGLQAELGEMPNHSACMASVFGIQLVHSDRSAFGHLINWLGNFWENVAQIDGRDWRIMDQILLQAFDVLSDEAQIMLICGPKGNGKTHRTERALRMFSPGWFTDSGGGSSKAGMQGTSDADNGCVCVCDEMIQELIEPNDPSGRIEWWKQMCTKRQFVYTKPLAHKNASGMEYLRTVKLVTPNYKTYVMYAPPSSNPSNLFFGTHACFWHTCLPTYHTCLL